MSTTWNLYKQCVEPVRVFDDALQWVFSILEMSDGRRHCQALTQLEVLYFVGWMPFCTCEELNEYRVEHLELELEPFPPHNFGVSKHA